MMCLTFISNHLSTASTNNDAFSLPNVLKKLETFAPLRLAESWDNVGLLVEPSTAVPVSTNMSFYKLLLVFTIL